MFSLSSLSLFQQVLSSPLLSLSPPQSSSTSLLLFRSAKRSIPAVISKQQTTRSTVQTTTTTATTTTTQAPRNNNCGFIPVFTSTNTLLRSTYSRFTDPPSLGVTRISSNKKSSNINNNVYGGGVSSLLTLFPSIPATIAPSSSSCIATSSTFLKRKRQYVLLRSQLNNINGEGRENNNYSSSSNSKKNINNNNSNSYSDDYKQQQQQQQQGSSNSGTGASGLVPKTGWNHNLPSETSDFWKQTSSSSFPSSSTSTSKNTSLKTGWLHNQQPAEILRQKQQQEPKGSIDNTGGSGTSTSTDRVPNIARLRLLYAMQRQRMNHRIVRSPTFHASTIGKRGIVVTDHVLSVPVYRISTTKNGYNNNNNNINNNNINDNKNANSRIDVSFTIVEAIDTKEQYDFFQSLVIDNPTTTTTTDTSSSPTSFRRANRNTIQQERAKLYVQNANMYNADSMMLYFQGGPGFGCPTPISSLSFSTPDSSWASKALSEGTYKRIVLMDQRGTGKSTPITKQTLQMQFPNLFLLDNMDHDDNHDDKNDVGMIDRKVLDEYKVIDPERYQKVKMAVQDVVEYMTQFRADNIVLDAEDIRMALLVEPNLDTPAGITQAMLEQEQEEQQTPKPWGCLLGQSFGGFCSTTYLSKVQYPPKVMLLTGGIPPLYVSDPIVLYDKFWDRVHKRNTLYYQMYPDDIETVQIIVRHLLSNERPVYLPSGGILTARRFLQLGIRLGSSPSSFASIHETINNAFVNEQSQSQQGKVFRRTFLKEMDSAGGGFDDAPLYYLLHEACYANGPSCQPTNWAAHRAYEHKCSSSKTIFDYKITSSSSSSSGSSQQQQQQQQEQESSLGSPTLFFGEMVFPWMSDGDYVELSGVGMKAVATALAEKSDWTSLYDVDTIRDALQTEKTQMAAAVYYDDMYVDFDESMKLVTGSTSIGDEGTSPSPPPLELCKVYITNEYQHSGLRDDGASIFSKLHGMAIRSIRTPS